jgi:hypothetical protein
MVHKQSKARARRTGPRGFRHVATDGLSLAPSLLAVYDGQRCLGFILSRNKLGWEAFADDDRSLGFFPDQAAASAAISNDWGRP